MAKLKFDRTLAGNYESGDWHIFRTEGEDRAPGYEWTAQDPDRGEHFFRTLREAKAAVRKMMGAE